MEPEDSGRSPEHEPQILALWQGKELGGEYLLLVTLFESAELGTYRSFGIRITMGGRTAEIPDLSTNEEAVRGFASLCAAGDAVPEQLGELAEDFLGTLYGCT